MKIDLNIETVSFKLRAFVNRGAPRFLRMLLDIQTIALLLDMRGKRDSYRTAECRGCAGQVG